MSNFLGSLQIGKALLFLCYCEFSKEVYDNECAECYAVDTECLEAVLFNKAHKELDDNEGYEEGYHDTDSKKQKFKRGSGKALHNELKHLKSRCACHYGNGEEEGKLRSGSTGYAGKHTAKNSRAGARCTGYKRKHLISADDKSILVSDIVDTFDAVFLIFFELFNKDKRYAVNNKSNSHHYEIIEMLVEKIIKQESEHCRRKDSDDNLEPEVPNLRLLFLCAFFEKGNSFFQKITGTARIAPS